MTRFFLLLAGLGSVSAFAPLFGFDEGLHSLESSYSDGFILAFGRFHYIMIHFPIALTVMTVIAELLWIWTKNPLFDHAARFMILAAALFVIPAVICGFILSYSHHYEGMEINLFQWHRLWGLISASLLLGAAALREKTWGEQEGQETNGWYYAVLGCAFVSIFLTGTFGGTLAFGFS